MDSHFFLMFDNGKCSIPRIAPISVDKAYIFAHLTLQFFQEVYSSTYSRDYFFPKSEWTRVRFRQRKLRLFGYVNISRCSGYNIFTVFKFFRVKQIPSVIFRKYICAVKFSNELNENCQRITFAWVRNLQTIHIRIFHFFFKYNINELLLSKLPWPSLFFINYFQAFQKQPLLSISSNTVCLKYCTQIYSWILSEIQ